MVGFALDNLQSRPGFPVWRTPLITLRAALLYPGRRLPLHLRGEKYKRLLAHAREQETLVAMGTQKEGSSRSIYEMVGVGRIIDSLSYPEGVHITLEGITRGRVLQQEEEEEYPLVLGSPVTEMGLQEEVEEEATGLLRELGRVGPMGRRDWSTIPLGEVADLVNAHLPQPIEKRQEVFEILDVALRIRKVRKLLAESRRERFPGRSFLS